MKIQETTEVGMCKITKTIEADWEDFHSLPEDMLRWFYGAEDEECDMTEEAE